MAVDVSRIPNNNKFDPVREAILQIEADIASGVSGVGSLNNLTGLLTIAGTSPITVSPSGNTITIGISSSAFSDYLSLSATNTQTISGSVVISGNLTVSGTTTTVNTTDLNVKDKNITLAYGTISASQADGAGITISGAAATMVYDYSNDRMVFNKPVEATYFYGDGSNLTNISVTETDTLQTVTNRGASTTNSITAASFVKSGGTGSQFLKADGSVDSSTYLTSISTDYFKKGADIGASQDLNNYTTDGYYHQNSNSQAAGGSNYPASVAGMLTVKSDGVMIYQTYQGYGTNGTWERKYYNGTWQSWHLIYDSGIFTNNSSLWNTAYGWGDHSTRGYLTSEADTLATVTTRGATTTNAITVGAMTSTGRFDVTKDSVGVITNYSASSIEATDAQLDIISSSAGTWGSALNLVEGASAIANTDVWSIARKTTGGTGDSSLNFNFGTSNQHDNTTRVSFASNGNATVTGNLTAASFIKSGGTGSQFLKADGTVDPSTYLTSEVDTLGTVTARSNTTGYALVVTNVDNSGNVQPNSNNIRVSGYGIIGNRGTFYVTNGGGDVQIGNGTTHNANPSASFSSTGISLQRPTGVTGTLSATSTITAGGSISASATGYVEVKADQTDSAAVRIGVSSGTNEAFLMADNTGAGHITGDSKLKMLLYNGSGSLIESGRFTTTGLGIGATDPNAKLEVRGARNEAVIRLASTTSDSGWVTGDRIGGIDFYSADASAAGAGVKGSISYESVGVSGGTTAMVFRVANTSAGTNNTEAMRITNSGSVEIAGNLSFSGSLVLDNGESIVSDAGAQLITTNSGETWTVRNGGGSDPILTLQDSLTNVLTTFDSNGYLGIGTNSPGAKIDIHTATNSNGLLIREDTDDSITHNFYVDSADNGVVILYANGQSAQIQLNTAGNSYFNGGNLGIGETSPAAKLVVKDGSGLGNAAGDYKFIAQFRGENANQSYVEIKDVRTAAGTDWTTAGMRIQGRIDSTYMGYMQFNGSGNNGGITFGTGTTTTAPGNVTERMRITSAGNVGIGITPSYKLDVDGTIRADALYDADNTAYYVDPASTSNLNALTTVGNVTVSGDIYGRSVNGQYSSLYRMGGIYFTWDSDSYGTNFNHSITSTFNGVYGDHLTINSYGHVKINIDSNGNGTNTFSIGRHTTGDANNMMILDESSNMTVYGSLRSPIFYDSNNTAYYVNPADTSMSAVLAGRMELIGTAPVIEMNDSNATSTTDQVGYVSFQINGTESGYVGFGSASNSYFYVRNNNGIIYNSGSYTLHANSSRAPIFYDSDNTSYFLNPDTTGVSLKIKGGIVSDAASGSILLEHQVSEANAWIFKENAANWGLYWFNAGSETDYTFGSYTTVGAELLGFRQGSTTNSINPNAWSGIDVNANATWMLSNYSGDFWSAGTQYSATDMRSPIFYDSDNTAYYLNAGSTSRLNQVDVNYVDLTAGNNYRLRFWNGADNYAIGMSTSTDTTYGGRVGGETTSDYNMYFTMSGGTNRGFVFRSNTNSSSCVAGIDASGNGRFAGDVIAYASSDKRLKDNIKPIENALDKIQQISGVTFNWNDKQDTYEQGKSDIGVIAQEIEAVVPEVVNTRESGYKAVRYEKLVPLLIEAIKEQQKQIDELKSIINNQ